MAITQVLADSLGLSPLTTDAQVMPSLYSQLRARRLHPALADARGLSSGSSPN
jgi:hypothetical protein